MFDDVEIFVDLQGTICMVLPGNERDAEPLTLECVEADDAYAPQE